LRGESGFSTGQTLHKPFHKEYFTMDLQQLLQQVVRAGRLARTANHSTKKRDPKAAL
jgi:hypothetical protein